jgi:hypothetical protein
VNSRNRWLVFLVFAASFKALGVVRNLTVDEGSMAVIHLAMGRSTVLHFHEKPTKVVAGNQNYFNIEFTGNDLTIQPLGGITSNLFTYGEYHRYGFILRVSGSDGYDDLVDVHWRNSTFIQLRPAPAPAATPQVVHEEKKQASSKKLKVSLSKVFHEKTFHVIEVIIQDKEGLGIDSKHASFRISQGQKTLAPKEIAFEKERSQSKEPLRVRIFIALPDKKELTIAVNVDDRTAQLSVPRRALE